VNASLRKIVKEMRVLEVPYQNAVRELEERYIIAVLMRHACHLGRAAEDLGVHRNTLTRIIRKLEIDLKQIRRLLCARTIDLGPVRSTAHSVWPHLGESAKWKNESREPRANVGATAGA